MFLLFILLCLFFIIVSLSGFFLRFLVMLFFFIYDIAIGVFELEYSGY